MSVKTEEDFQVNNVVWAKIKGYPWWPARIENINGLGKNPYDVMFLGENTKACLNNNNIKPYKKYKQTFESKCKQKKFLDGLSLAENIIKTEYNINEKEIYDSSKSDLNEFKEQSDDLKKSLREENNSNNQEDKDECKEIESNTGENLNQAFVYSIKNSKDENEKSLIQSQEILLNKKRKRSISESSLEIIKNVDDQGANKGKTRLLIGKNKNSKSPSQIDHLDNEIIKTNSDETINLEKGEIYKLNEIDEPVNQVCDQSNIPNPEGEIINEILTEIKNYPPITSDSMIVDSPALPEKDQPKIIEENSNEIFNSYVISLKLAVDSFSRNASEIISTVKNIDDFTNKSSESGMNTSENFIETFSCLKETYQILLENSEKIPKIVKNSVEISKKCYTGHKLTENSSLISDIENLIKEQLSEIENDVKISKVEKSEIQEGNASLSKYSNLWNFMKSILSHEFNCVFDSHEFSSIKNFHDLVINGNYLKEEIQKLKKAHIGTASEKKREKTKIRLDDILLKCVIFNFFINLFSALKCNSLKTF